MGLIPDREARIVTRSLKINTNGNIQELGGTLVLSDDVLLGGETFQPILSQYAMDMYNRLSVLDKEYVYLGDFTVDDELSIVLRDTGGLPEEVTAYMSYLYLELYSLFTSMVKYRAGQVLKMTIPEIDIISSNLRYIHAKIGSIGNQENVYNLANVLKHIQRSILFVKKGILSIQR
jgi:hypothetical protein